MSKNTQKDNINDLDICYKNRFDKEDLAWKQKVWAVLCKDFFQNYISSKDTVIDFGAGYCEFINIIKCKNKIAVDLNPHIKEFADKDVRVLITSPDKLPSGLKGKVNIVFISNFLEHLNSKDEVIKILKSAYDCLSIKGKILILQPNISLVKEKYWDFIDHKISLNGPSIIEALEITGFSKMLYIEKFLPLRTQSKFPKSIALVKIFLKLPEFLRFFAGQSLFIFQKC